MSNTKALAAATASLTVGAISAGAALWQTTAMTMLAFSALGIPALAAAGPMFAYAWWPEPAPAEACPRCQAEVVRASVARATGDNRRRAAAVSGRAPSRAPAAT